MNPRVNHMNSGALLAAVESLTIVIPTVRGREELLRACLVSVRSQTFGELVEVVVSGNGTTPASQEIAEEFQARFFHYPERLHAHDHTKKILERLNRTYFWFVGDDDLMAPQALKEVLGVLLEAEQNGVLLDEVIGRARIFSAENMSDLSEPHPDLSQWEPGFYESLIEVAGACKGVTHLGAIVFRTSLLSSDAMDRYRGTSHEIFGGFWEGLVGRNQGPRVVILEAPLVLLRQVKKEWDNSFIKTQLGLRHFKRMVPEPISRVYLAGEVSHFSLGDAVRASSLSIRGERTVMREYVITFPSRDPFALVVAQMPRSVGETALLLGRIFSFAASKFTAIGRLSVSKLPRE